MDWFFKYITCLSKCIGWFLGKLTPRLTTCFRDVQITIMWRPKFIERRMVEWKMALVRASNTGRDHSYFLSNPLWVGIKPKQLKNPAKKPTQTDFFRYLSWNLRSFWYSLMPCTKHIFEIPFVGYMDRPNCTISKWIAGFYAGNSFWLPNLSNR